MAWTKSVIKRKYKIHIPIFLILLFFLSKIISHSDSQLCSLNRNLIKDMEDLVGCLAWKVFNSDYFSIWFEEIMFTWSYDALKGTHVNQINNGKSLKISLQLKLKGKGTRPRGWELKNKGIVKASEIKNTDKKWILQF